MVEHRKEQPAQAGGWATWPLAAAQSLGSACSFTPRRAIRFAWLSCYLFVGAIALIVVVGSLLVARLTQGPIVVSGLGSEIALALDERFGHGYKFTLGQASILKRGYAPTVSVDGLSVKDGTGKTILTAPRAEVSVDLWSLLTGRVRPSRLEVLDVELRMALLPDGSLALPTMAASNDSASLDRAASQQNSAGSGSMSPFAGSALASPQVSIRPQDPPGGQSGARPRALLVKQMAASIRALIDALTKPDSPIAAIDRIGIARGRLVIDDRAADQTVVFNGVKLGFDKSSGKTTFNLSVDGPNGRWEANGLAGGSAGGERRLVLSLRNLSLDEILLATGARSIGADFDMPVSAKVDFGLNADGSLSKAAGEVDFGSGFLRFDDPNDEPMIVDSMHGGFHWEASTRRIIIDRSALTAGATHAALAGFVAPPIREGDPWTIDLRSDEHNVAAPERPGQKPVVIDHGEFKGQLFLTEKKLILDRFSFKGPECGFAMAGEVEWSNGPHLRLGASISPTPVAVALRLWPSFMVAPVRSYLLSHAKDGLLQKASLQLDFDADMLAAMRAEHAPPDDSVALDFTVENGSLEFLSGVPYLHGVNGVGHITGRTSTFTTTSVSLIEASEGRDLYIAEGSTFHLNDAELKPTPAAIVAKVSSTVEAIGDLLSRDALKPFASLPLDPSTVKGQVDGRLEIDLNLGPKMGPSDVSLKINAAVTNFTAENLLGKEKLDAATLTIDVDPNSLRASGQGWMFGAPATLDMVRPKGKPADATISVTLDDAARAKQNLNCLPGLTGPIGATISAPLGSTDKLKAQVELDLTRANYDWLGISKPAGKPAKARFTLAAYDNGTVLDPFVLEAGPIQARGVIDLGADQALSSARMSQVRVSSGDDMKIDATKAGDSLKVMVRASTIDARPFVKWLISASPDSNGAASSGERKDALPPIDPGPAKDQTAAKEPTPVKEVELDLKSGLLTGSNKEVVTGAELRLVKDGDQIKQMSFSGRFGRDPVSGNLTGYPAAPQVNFMSEDAGSLLSFVDLYKHMDGGRLAVSMRIAPDALAGVLTIDSFVLRDEPALRRLVAEGVPSSQAGNTRHKIDAGAMEFTKLEAQFQRAGSRVDIHSGTIHGEAIGLTVEGWVDYAHDRVDMQGTFVPVYSVNNLFSKIPVFGLILGGGANEGLIGVNYRVEGAISAPTLNINPLSAVAPGIFRQIFGVGGNVDAPGGIRQ